MFHAFIQDADKGPILFSTCRLCGKPYTQCVGIGGGGRSFPRTPDDAPSGSLDAYQTQAIATAVYPRTESIRAYSYTALKLAGEAGEVAQEIGKAIRDDAGIVTEERRARLRLELGDVLWYVSALAHDLGFPLSEIACANLDKLRSRKTRGTIQGSGEDR